MRNEYRAYLQQCKEQESLYHQIALSLGLPDSVLYLLYTIAEQGDRKNPGRLYSEKNPGRLYSEWSISKQTGHSAVEWLKKRDLVTLEPDPQDRRGKLVVLTPAGKDYIQTKVAPIMQAEERAFLRLTQEQREALTTLIRRTTNYFKEEVEALAVRKETEDDDPTL